MKCIHSKKISTLLLYSVYSPRIWEDVYKIPPIPSTHISPETINSAIATNYVVNYVYFKSQSYIFCNEGSTHMHYTIEYNYMRAIACIVDEVCCLSKLSTVTLDMLLTGIL